MLYDLCSVLAYQLGVKWDACASDALKAAPAQQHGPEVPVQQKLQATYDRLQSVLQHLCVNLADRTARALESIVWSLLTSTARHDSLISQLHLFGSDYYEKPHQGCLPARQEEPLTASHM